MAYAPGERIPRRKNTERCYTPVTGARASGTLRRVKDSLRYTPNDETTAPASVSAPRKSGLFVVFEGADGSGKTTQLRLLAEKLTERGYPVVCTREPGGTDIGERLRTLVLETGETPVDYRTEALIFAASRAAHTAEVIRPALEAGKIVLCDRYIDSSAAYQGAGRELGVETVVALSRWATGNLLPDITLVLHVPTGEESTRISLRGGTDRIEAAGEQFRERVGAEFTALASLGETGQHELINGVGTTARVHQRVLAALEPFLADYDKLDRSSGGA